MARRGATSLAGVLMQDVDLADAVMRCPGSREKNGSPKEAEIGADLVEILSAEHKAPRA